MQTLPLWVRQEYRFQFSSETHHNSRLAPQEYLFRALITRILFFLCQDVDHDGRLTFSDFKQAVAEDPLMLEGLGTCLPDQKVRKVISPLRALIPKNSH